MNVLPPLLPAFRRHFAQEPACVVRAPGRVNLIGEHTDYNDGFVLPMAIDRALWIALRPRPDRRVRLFSLDFGDEAAFDLEALARGKDHWIEYVKGVAWALSEAGYPLAGWEGVLAGDVPVGAGLSSSAALEMAVARAFAAVTPFAWEPVPLARAGQRAENGWVGVQSGIMDQMIAAAGRAGHALLLDCRSLAWEAVPLPAGATVVVMDTQTRRGLVHSAYNERHEQCRQAARLLDVPALRDVTPAQLESQASRLDPLTLRRARHVASENDRVLQAVAAMRAADARRLGQLMNASHASLQHDFAVSSPALDTIVACARQEASCFGARMTGAGFGGCAVALVDSAEVAAFTRGVAGCYQARTGLEPSLYLCQATDGACLWPAGTAE